MLAEALAVEHRLPSSEAARVRLAAHPDTPLGTLRLLAADPAVTVRAAVAMNPSYAPAIHTHLASDDDERVRALLAGKMARLVPSLSGRDRLEALSHVHDTLLTLAEDAAIRVRSTLAEILHAMPDAPRAVIMRLAQDKHVSVSGPVLRLSPLLTDADLLELLAVPSHESVAHSVATRVGLSSAVCDAIADAADSTAIHTLLQNGSAMIRECTLDALVGRAGDHPEWHEPLTQRPSLPERTAHALSLMVAGHLLEAMLGRADLPASLTERIRTRLVADKATDEATLLEELSRQHRTMPLNEADLVASAGDPRRMRVILAIAGRVPVERLHHTVTLRNAKGLVSLVWHAGFSMAAAMLVQSTLGAFGPGQALAPAPDGGFPLSADEMEWQIELLAEPGS